LSSKYYDTSAAIQVIGNVLNNPDLLDDSEYVFREDDFDNDFHRVVFGAAYNLHFMGAERLNTTAIEEFLKDKEKSYALYKVNNGAEWMHEAFINADVMNFEYYYKKLKKFTLLRTYDKIGMDVTWIYDPDNIVDLDLKEQQAVRLDEMSIQQVADMIDNRVLRVREVVVDNDIDESCQIGDGIDDMLKDLQSKPIVGNPLYDPYTNEVVMGARMGTFYIRSAGTGVGKSRTSLADACWLACDKYYADDSHGWIDLGRKCPTVFISVELDKEELQTMAIAFISGVSENKIIKNSYDAIEAERIKEAMKVLRESALYIEYFPDYSMKDIENCIKRNLRIHKANYVFFDYIASSMKIIEEVTRASGGMKIREDQVLYLLSSKLKEIASTFNVFIMSATQLNGSFKHEKILDQTVLSGAKAIANRVDVGMIMVDVSPEDMDDLEPLLNAYPGLGIPNVKVSVYKNRRGQYNRIVLWMAADKSTCRYKTLFATDYNLELVDIPLTKVGGE
jgi:replicative DNA helicase